MINSRFLKWFNRFTSVLVSRFMLNLRQAVVSAGGDAQFSIDTDFSIPAFNAQHSDIGFPTESRITGSMGAPLDHTIREVDVPSESSEEDAVFKLDQGTGVAGCGNDV